MTNPIQPHVTRHPTLARSRQLARRALPFLTVAAIASLCVPATARDVRPIKLESDKVYQQDRRYLLGVSGVIDWWYAANNPQHRFVGLNVEAYQLQGSQRPMCIGIRVTYSVQRVSGSSRGGTGGGTVGLTGPSVTATQTWNTTTSSGVTSDGFEWQCPQQNYVKKQARGGRWIHPQVDGVVYGVAIDTCLAYAANLSNRWCLPTEFNRYGAK